MPRDQLLPVLLLVGVLWLLMSAPFVGLELGRVSDATGVELCQYGGETVPCHVFLAPLTPMRR